MKKKKTKKKTGGAGPEALASRLTTELGWDDLVLPPEVVEEVKHLVAWIRHRDALVDTWGLRRAARPGYTSLFAGDSGTGKTMAAALIGAEVGAPVYRIDLAAVGSRYIGETEKNLADIFRRAEETDWILYFDEADALFGKRTGVKDAHDRYANIEVPYLLQRMEAFTGLTILATNRPDHLDEALVRRLQSVIVFPPPDADLRFRIWKGVLGDRRRLTADVDLSELARAHELTGGGIVNAVRAAALRALARGDEAMSGADLAEGIRRERARPMPRKGEAAR
ncbi:MAG TPA: ATP-binding protein [Longimicrobiales bacterium]|nr:ATP-binding protein [Longimicrobiales bacterium]